MDTCPKTPERNNQKSRPLHSKSQPTTPNASSLHSNIDQNNKSPSVSNQQNPPQQPILHLPPPTTPTSHHYYQRRYARLHQSPLAPQLTPSSSEKHLKSPHATPPRSIELQDRFMPARTPRSARMRLDFSDSDQGPLSQSPFQKSPVKNLKTKKNDSENGSDLTFATSRLFRTQRSRQQAQAQSQNSNQSSNTQTTTRNINDSLQIGQNREQLTYNALIANEVLNAGIQHIPDHLEDQSSSSNNHPKTHSFSNIDSSENTNSNFAIKPELDEKMKMYTSPNTRRSLFEYSNINPPSSTNSMDTTNPYTMSPLSNASQKLLSSPRRPQRKIPKMPFKVLDAPELADDFYLNLVDWGLNNSLAVGLGNCVYLWNASNSNVTKLCDYTNENDQITSVSWCDSGISPALGSASRQNFMSNFFPQNQNQERLNQERLNQDRVNQERINQQNQQRISQQRLDQQSTSITSNLAGSSSSLSSSASQVPLPVFGNSEQHFQSSSLPSTISSATTSGIQTPTINTDDLIDADSTLLAQNSSNESLLSENNNKTFEKFNQKNSPQVPPDLHNEMNNTNHQNLIAVGTSKGCVQIFDVETQKQIHNLKLHDQRVGALAWNNNLITSGSRDRYISQFDIRVGQPSVKKFSGHRQEVCGLRWSPDRTHLASGGNDNKLLVWSVQNQEKPQQVYAEHIAAVKAIAWSPHQHGLLASGGGTADRCIKFWNTQTQQPQSSIDTGSQVCNLAWSRHNNEVVSTHGYSQNQIIVWRYPSMTPIAKLIGHTFRVLFLAMSPTGEAIVTGAGDETLRFWNVFSKSRSLKQQDQLLSFGGRIR